MNLPEIDQPQSAAPSAPLFQVEMMWGQQPVRLTASCCQDLPTDAPTTSVHIVALLGGKVLVVRDRKGVFGYPGGRLEAGETLADALKREVYEEANAYIEDGYKLFALLKIECTAQLPGRAYPHPFSYMAMYAGVVSALDPISRDPAGIIAARALFNRDECARFMDAHDRILLREALRVLCGEPGTSRRVKAFLASGCGAAAS